MIFDGVDKRGFKPGGTSTDMMGIDLTGSDPQKRVGTSLLLKVMAGDKFRGQVSAYYADNYSTDEGATTGEAMMGSLFTSLSGGMSELGNENGGADIVNRMISPDNYLNTYNSIKDNVTDPTQPKAFLNYLLFDEDMNLVPEQSGALQVTSANAGQWQMWR